MFQENNWNQTGLGWELAKCPFYHILLTKVTKLFQFQGVGEKLPSGWQRMQSHFARGRGIGSFGEQGVVGITLLGRLSGRRDQSSQWVIGKISARKQSSLSGKESAQGCIPKRLLGRPD